MGGLFSCFSSKHETSNRYNEIHNDSIKEKLLVEELGYEKLNNKISALETRTELRCYEVDLALKYLGESMQQHFSDTL